MRVSVLAITRLAHSLTGRFQCLRYCPQANGLYYLTCSSDQPSQMETATAARFSARQAKPIIR